MRRLYLLRHAKSSWAQPALDDHDRPLNRRGRNACAALSAHIEAAGIEPSLVLCSSAARTVETLERIAPALGSPRVAVEPDLYLASGPLLLARILAIDDAAPDALLIGHNPGMHELALALAADGPERDRFAGKLPTGALVTLELAVGAWADVAPGGASVASVVFPRELE